MHPTRRHVLKGLTSSALISTLPITLTAATPPNQVILGAHLPIWQSGNLDGTSFWSSSFDELKENGITNCLILVYRFVDPETGEIYKKSRFTKAETPATNFINQALTAAKAKGITAALYPVLEIDNHQQIGAIWRGNLNFFGTTLSNFFKNYQKLIFDLAQMMDHHEFKEIYIGSELASLSHNIAARPHWEQLIYELRTKLPSKDLTFTYAAHWEEYLTFPFWHQLDVISLNAYFPLASPEEARGLDIPSQPTLEQKIAAKFNELKIFAQKNKRPLQISEFGFVKFDQTTARPWEQAPSHITDTYEQINAYSAFLNVTRQQSSWLKTVNLWHWQLQNTNVTPYSIANNSEISALIRRFSNNE